jgi:hypothetical protein
MITAKSMPSGRKKIKEESRAAITTSPAGVRKYPRRE